MPNVLAIGLVHLSATSHICSRLTHYCSALCTSLGCHWPVLVIAGWAHLLFSAMYHCWIVTWPILLIIIGGPIHHHWVIVRAYSLLLECYWALLVFIGSCKGNTQTTHQTMPISQT